MERDRTKAIPFRPTDKAVQRIKATMREKGLDRSKAINYLLELDPTERREGVTGKLLECPLRPTSVPICAAAACAFRSSVVYLKAEVDTSVCQSCSKRPTCESWSNLESYERVSRLQDKPSRSVKHAK